MIGRDIGTQRLNWRDEEHPDYVWVNVSETGKDNNRHFEDQWTQLRRYGIPRGAYHTAHPANPVRPALEAKRLIHRLGNLASGDCVAIRCTDSAIGNIETVGWLLQQFKLLDLVFRPRVYLATTPEFLNWLEFKHLHALADKPVWLIGEESPFPLWTAEDSVVSGAGR